MKKLLFLLLIVPFIGFSQDKGVTFEHGVTWQAVKEKAKTENKFIFVDCFTTWCKPCEYMSKTVFPQDTVGEFFNAHFINLKVQMDQTDHDAPETKSWYTEAQRFADDYQVVAYPTFLIFDPQGELVHRIVGGGEASEFIARAKQGLDPKTQYVTLVNKYHQNPDDAMLSKQMLNAALGAYDRPLAQEAASRYIELLGEEAMLTPGNIDILLRGAKSSDSPAFTIIKNNKDKVDELLLNANQTAND
ncbi:MAG: thioredoxin family protein, partial [Sphingobacterium sp.]